MAYAFQPSCVGFVESAHDAVVLFEACLKGFLPTVCRRPTVTDREVVIRSGNIFVFDENESEIRRWTDGVRWSPSRMHGNFLIYRELHSASSRKVKAKGDLRSSSSNAGASSISDEQYRGLYGSLITSYNFKTNGLVKKTLSVVVDGSKLHMVSYYRADDVLSGRLRSISAVRDLFWLQPRAAMMTIEGGRSRETNDVETYVSNAVVPAPQPWKDGNELW